MSELKEETIMRGTNNMKLIQRLTKEQEAKIPEYVKRGLKLGLETHPEGITEEMKPAIEEAIASLYAKLNLPMPEIAYAPSIRAGKHVIDARLGNREWRWDFVAGSQELHWLYFYKFINDELPVKQTDLPLNELTFLCEQVGWFFPYDQLIVVTPKPAELHMNSRNRLHRVGAPAVTYLDGYSLDALNGVRLTGLEHLNRPDANPKDIIAVKNVEQRGELIKAFGVAKLLDHLKVSVLDSQGDYSLLSVPIFDDGRTAPRIYLKMNNPSVEEVHIEAVDPACRTVGEALSWRNFGTAEIPFVPPVILT